MPGATLMITAMVLFFGGVVTLMAALFSSGGGPKSQQLRVVRELWRGEHGQGKRWAVRLGLLSVVVGAIVGLAGISASDRERARLCEVHCAASGLRGTIGPSAQPHPTRKGAAAFVACICQGPGDVRQESRADDLH